MPSEVRTSSGRWDMPEFAQKQVQSRPTIPAPQPEQAVHDSHGLSPAIPLPRQAAGGAEASQLGFDLRHMTADAPAGTGNRSPLAMTEPGDAWEREADRVAGLVTGSGVRTALGGGPPR